MKQLSLPSFAYRMMYKQKKTFIFGQLRKKYVCLTPEEWVRQHIINYLVNYLWYPKALMSAESKVVRKGDNWQRADILIHNNTTVPLMMIECKAPYKILTQPTVTQMMKYNKQQIPLVVFTNGIQHFCYGLNTVKKSYTLLPSIPSFAQIQQFLSHA